VGHDKRSSTFGSGSVVVIASPVRGLRQAWHQGLKGFTVVEVTDRGQLKQCLAEGPPAVVLLDLELPELGIDGVPALRALQPATKILALAGHADDKQGVLALKAGASGYCERTISAALLRRALDAIQQGEIWVGRKLTAHLLDELSALTAAAGAPHVVADKAAVPDIRSRLNRLTRRERDIVVELGVGSSNKEIAQKLSVTERTVKAHLTAAFRKLEASGRLQAALFMVEHARAGEVELSKGA
jgi:two-component system, NarL family, nitrate/nitrite response regulator NarL